MHPKIFWSRPISKSAVIESYSFPNEQSLVKVLGHL
jgi:hypothetical protein